MEKIEKVVLNQGRVLRVILLAGALLIIKMFISILIPLASAIFIALLFLPLAQLFEKRFFFRRLTAAAICMIILILLMAGIFLLITGQISSIGKNLNLISHNIREQFVAIRVFAKNNLSLDESKIQLITSGIRTELLRQGELLLRTFVFQFSGMLANVIVIPVYVFLIMLYRKELKSFFISINDKKNAGKTLRIIKKIEHVVPRYLGGLLIEMMVVMFMSITGFLIVGIPYAAFLGVLAGLLNVIPYVGNLIAGSLAMLTALAFSNNLMSVLAAFVVSSLVQLIDNNIVLPKIVASRVNINALLAIIAILAGGTIAGIGGMFLALPSLAMLKICFDESERWRAVGELLGKHN
jgi:predicted PurR-regulated permease PerM